LEQEAAQLPTMIKEDEMPVRPHAFHLNLPSHHMDGKDGVPFITKFAQDKARMIVRLAHSIQLTEALYINEDEGDEEDDIDMLVDQDNGERRQNDGDYNVHAIIDEHTLVSTSYILFYSCITSHFYQEFLRLMVFFDTHLDLVSNSSLWHGILLSGVSNFGFKC
jgi:hypothetical protein